MGEKLLIDGKSITDYCVFVGGNLLSSKNKKIRCSFYI